MTNTETLFTYRLRQADETLQDIDNLISSHSSGLQSTEKAREFVAAIKELIATQ